MKFLTNVDLFQNQLLNAKLQSLASAPTVPPPVQGQVYYDTTIQSVGEYNGTSWRYTLPAQNALSSFALPTANIALNNFKITGLGLGSSAGDAATVQNVQNALDAALKSFIYKAAARTAYTTNQLLGSPALINDGVTVVTGDRVLLTAQTTATQNGIYTYTGSAFVRANNAAENFELIESATWLISEGTVATNQLWRIANTGVITPETTAISIVLVASGGTTYTASATGGLTVSSNAFSVSKTGAYYVPYKFTQAIGNGSLTSIVVADGLPIQKVASVQDASGNEVICDKVFAANQTTFNFSVAPSANQYIVTIIG